MGIEKISEKESLKDIEDCICGKKNFVKKVDNMEVCDYEPLKKGYVKRLCRCVDAVYSCNKGTHKGTHYVCGKNMAYAKPKA